MKKSIFVIVLCCALLLCFAACKRIELPWGQVGNNQNGQTGDSQNGQTGDSQNGQTGDNQNGQTGDNQNGQTGDNQNGQTGDNQNGQTGDNQNGQTGDNQNGQTGDNQNGQTGDNQGNLGATTQPSQEMTLERFLTEFSGFWVEAESIAPYYEDQYMYYFRSFSTEEIWGGAYPGEGSRTAKATALKVLDKNVYELTLFYEAGMHMGDFYEESTGTLTITVVSQDKIIISYGEGSDYLYIYGGQSLDDAQAAAQAYANS